MLSIIIILDGQKIAKRLSANISKETKSIRKLVDEYNSIATSTNDSHIPVNMSDAMALDSAFYCPFTDTSKLPWNKQKDIISAYLLVKRSEEELVLLQTEMQNVLAYCTQCKEKISQQINNTRAKEDQYSRGMTALLSRLFSDVDIYHAKVKATFATMDCLSTETVVCSDNDTDSSDDDMDDDDDVL